MDRIERRKQNLEYVRSSSFEEGRKAGIKEVVEWIKLTHTALTEAKLKEWGIVKEVRNVIPKSN